MSSDRNDFHHRLLGYIEGSNLLIEYRYAENKLDRLPELARELVGAQVHVRDGSVGSR